MPTPSPTTDGPLLRNFIGGEWVESRGSDELLITDPATGERLARVPLSPAREVGQAVAAARDAFPAWRAIPAVQRARVMFRLKQLLEEHLEELALGVSREPKPKREIRKATTKSEATETSAISRFESSIG